MSTTIKITKKQLQEMIAKTILKEVDDNLPTPESKKEAVDIFIKMLKDKIVVIEDFLKKNY